MSNRIITLILLIIIAVSFMIIKDRLFPSTESTAASTTSSVAAINENQQKIIGETHYLFDIADNGPIEIKNLLERAESLSNKAKFNNTNSRIAMVIHGPDINIFDRKNYEMNKEIVDLAARLDASNVIDFKVCKATANSRGINESSFPSFMEVVPFAPEEIDRLENEGYFKLQF